MGLDMYLTGEIYFWNWQRKRGEKKADLIDLGYWRKHPNLHGFIVENFADGIDDCRPIYLDTDHIREIMDAVEANKLPPTVGFFFGESDGSEKEQDLAIFREALQWLEAESSDFSRSVYYQASW